MAREIANAGASVRARLLNRSREEKSDFQILLTRYVLERLLYRLGISEQRGKFVLKGAMLFAIWLDDSIRPTRDLDLLGYGDPNPIAISGSFRSICSLAVPNDGVIFDIDGIEVSRIRDNTEYSGVRVRTRADVAGALVRIQIDVGFGDAITPHAVEIKYPALLDAPAPNLLAYPPETVVAEKTEALVSLGRGNSRMKDFFDLWTIAQTFPFDGGVLSEALRRTFERRGTAWPEKLPIGLKEDFALEKDAQWQAYLSRDRLGGVPASFFETVKCLRAFLGPALDRKSLGSWPPGGPWTYAETA